MQNSKLIVSALNTHMAPIFHEALHFRKTKSGILLSYYYSCSYYYYYRHHHHYYYYYYYY